MSNNREDYSEYLWFDTLPSISKDETISLITCYCYENIAVWLKDREKLEQLFTLIKMIPEYICRGDPKIEKNFKVTQS